MSNVTHTDTTTDSANYFARLNAINVNGHVEKKGGFSYLSWPYAVAQLRLADASATWEVRRFNGLPYLATEAGVFVEVAVTVNGVSLTTNEAAGNIFTINLIPHTLENTTLKHLTRGSRVNLEVDLIARYCERMLSYQNTV